MKLLKELFKSKKSDPWDGLKDEHRIIPAFDFEGVQYYQFEDTFNLCSGRAFAALDFYQETRMKCTREFLEAHCDVVSQKLDAAVKSMLITTDVLDLNQLNTIIKELTTLNNQLNDRLTMLHDHDSVYKLASVVYFTKQEKVYDFDYKYNIEKKIPAFKRMDEAFFLLMHASDLIPFGGMSPKDLRTYLQTQQKVTQHQLENLLSQSSEGFKKTESFKRLDSLMNTALEQLSSEESH